MSRIIVGVTGGVAAILTPKLIGKLLAAGHEVRIVATEAGKYFMPPNSVVVESPPVVEDGPATEVVPSQMFVIDSLTQQRVPLFLNKHEWPIGGYHKNDPVAHIEARKWAEAMLIAPLTANTLAKMSYAMADNFLTCIVRAWERDRPIVIAPAMNTNMWTHPATSGQINRLSNYYPIEIAWPVKKRLACGDDDMGAMADIDDIVNLLEFAIYRRIS